MDHARLLIADDEPSIRDSLSRMLKSAGHEVEVAETGEQVLEKIRASTFDLVLLDMNFPPSDGLTVLKEIKRIRPQILVVAFSGHASVQSVLEGFRSGAYEFLVKPIMRPQLLDLADRAVSIRKLGAKRSNLAEQLEHERVNVLRLREQLGKDDPFEKLVGNSPIFQNFVETIREVARTDSTVLLTGESGTGKGLVARTIHQAASRRGGPFVEANCVVYSEGVLHSELFGHERGAFTGAARTKKGRFELAQGGTLFLDEIGEITSATQLLLLRVLQERTFERVGGEETLEADVRLIAATNRDLQAAIKSGEFRSDLFYRLNVIPVHVPALREHLEDVPVLIQCFMERCAERTSRNVDGFSDEAINALCQYPWPGNIRELENMVERLVVLNRSGTVGVLDLPDSVRQAATTTTPLIAPGTLHEMERWRIVEALSEAQGNKKAAAKILGIHRSTLYAKMKRYGLDESSTNDSPDLDPARVADRTPVPVR